MNASSFYKVKTLLHASHNGRTAKVEVWFTEENAAKNLHSQRTTCIDFWLDSGSVKCNKSISTDTAVNRLQPFFKTNSKHFSCLQNCQQNIFKHFFFHWCLFDF